MCQINTFMFKDEELDGEKVLQIIKIFQKVGFINFYEYSNPNLRNISKDLRLFQCGNFCDCGSIVTKKLVVDEMLEMSESEKLNEIFANVLQVVSSAYLFSHWFKGCITTERINLERVPLRVKLEKLDTETYRSLFYNQVLEVSK